MKKELELLKKEFEKIKKRGYIESTRSGPTGIGKTFEDLLGKKEDTLGLPDYHGIEIKTKRGYNKQYITLFNCVPKGENEYEIKRLRDKYGYPDRFLKNYKVLSARVYANRAQIIANKYLFKLKVDREREKLFLAITGKQFDDFEMTTYWDFKTLKEKLETKLSYLAFIKAWPNRINGKEHYKYYDIEFFKLKGFDNFINLLESGAISVNFDIGICRSGENIGKIKDHGTSFGIKESDLNSLFERIKI